MSYGSAATEPPTRPAPDYHNARARQSPSDRGAERAQPQNSPPSAAQPDTPRKSRVWACAALPRWLKAGPLGAADAWAREDGTFRYPLTVASLVKHRYGGGRTLTRRTVQYHLRVGEALGLLTIDAAANGRGHARVYRWHAERLATLDPSDPWLVTCPRRKGCNERALRITEKGCNGPEISTGERALQRALPTSEKGRYKGRYGAEEEGRGTGSREEELPALRAVSRPVQTGVLPWSWPQPRLPFQLTLGPLRDVTPPPRRASGVPLLVALRANRRRTERRSRHG